MAEGKLGDCVPQSHSLAGTSTVSAARQVWISVDYLNRNFLFIATTFGLDDSETSSNIFLVIVIDGVLVDLAAATLHPEDLTEALVEQVFAVKIDGHACRFASLYL